MSVRIERVEPCEHGEWYPHRTPDEDSYLSWTECSGGFRTVLTGFPPEAIEAMKKAMKAHLVKLVVLAEDGDPLADDWDYWGSLFAETGSAAVWETLTGDNK